MNQNTATSKMHHSWSSGIVSACGATGREIVSRQGMCKVVAWKTTSKLIWTLAAMHTGVVQNKSIACQADPFLYDGKKEKFSWPVFLLQSNLLLKKWQPMCMAASVHMYVGEYPEFICATLQMYIARHSPPVLDLSAFVNNFHAYYFLQKGCLKPEICIRSLGEQTRLGIMGYLSTQSDRCIGVNWSDTDARHNFHR
jgi:hypothetical protein